MDMYLDCGNGISGDMTLAALVHLGLNLAPLTAALARAGVDCRIEARPETRGGGPGRRVDVSWDDGQPLRHPADIAAILNRLEVGDTARRRALAVLEALTLAEAEAHQIAPEEVHFHEVGAVDTLVDIIGVCWGLEQLGAGRVTASPLPWFSGTVECAHGLIPLPAPACAWLMRGKPVWPTGAREELVTPTGAALTHVLVDEFTDGPQGVPIALGTGYGSRPASAGLRVWLVEPVAESVPHARGGLEHVLQLESHLDHLSGEELGLAITALAALPETLDVLWLPGIGKKNRPAGLLRVLCRPQDGESVSLAVLRHTHSLGLRRQRLERLVLPREAAGLSRAGETLEAKAYTLEGRRYVRAEADAVRAAAARLGVGAPALRFGE
ncbi:LarC family nickel insertion protein [Desulfovibrio sp. SGI.169]|uniref:LarC family nickel insertion protein n=1 Tax=Desulfovibrio sp. SGI.169 TaxID=3420561 RepID=UPI003CFD63AA